MRPLPRVMQTFFRPPVKRPGSAARPPMNPPAMLLPRLQPSATREGGVTLEQAERLLHHLEGRPAAITNPFSAFPNRSLWLYRMMTDARAQR